MNKLTNLWENIRNIVGICLMIFKKLQRKKVISDLKEYVRDLTDYQDFDYVPFEELLDIIRY